MYRANVLALSRGDMLRTPATPVRYRNQIEDLREAPPSTSVPTCDRAVGKSICGYGRGGGQWLLLGVTFASSASNSLLLFSFLSLSVPWDCQRAHLSDVASGTLEFPGFSGDAVGAACEPLRIAQD
jgi:hypothetical protein